MSFVFIARDHERVFSAIDRAFEDSVKCPNVAYNFYGWVINKGWGYQIELYTLLKYLQPLQVLAEVNRSSQRMRFSNRC
jgi:hypothetical protein